MVYLYPVCLIGNSQFVMAFASVFALCFFSHLVLIHSAPAESNSQSVSSCPESFPCGRFRSMKFPFTDFGRPSCGLCMVDCESESLLIQLGQEANFSLVSVSEPNNTIQVNDSWRRNLSESRRCNSFYSYSFFNSSISLSFSPNLTMFRCYNYTLDGNREADRFFSGYLHYKGCQDYSLYYRDPSDGEPIIRSNLPSQCFVIQLPLNPTSRNLDASNPFNLLAFEFSVEFHVSDACLECHRQRGQCKQDRENQFYCDYGKEGGSHLTLILATVIPGALILMIISAILTILLHKRGNYFSHLLSTNISSDPSSKRDLEGGNSLFFGVPILSHSELEEATNNFDPSEELGDGGFGTVYHGKLRDGREVAVKRLYQHNYKRVEQFMNEIKILTRLRHKNLVSLYGCTSRHSRELLLVYEYVANGTVADHIHGERAKAQALTWPVRMSIAIEAASALAYLHASDIIHRDVKTNNILLDDNFRVKVADFGLSRLFPDDVTHVSTAPQGTPGYVDPEYNQCFQLTDKSDVYSFGVVLIELISSMPAVDIRRHRHDINLANLAMNRIQKCAFDELIDESLGFESDDAVRGMTISVAELAFRCLQLEKELRPTMDEVLQALKEIKGEEPNVEKMEGADRYRVGLSRSLRQPLSPECEDIMLLKNIKSRTLPNSTTDHLWTSGSTTSSTNFFCKLKGTLEN